MYIDKKFIENEKRIAELDSDSSKPLITECIQDALEIAKSGKFDEVRFSLNGVKLVADINSNFEDLHKEFLERVGTVSNW